MTEASSPPIYPQYCFHLSPTINQWCPLQAKDIEALGSHPGFEGQNLFFLLNHPIKWVRIAGVIVAVDEYHGRRVYTVDDSSGINIECMVMVPVTDATQEAKSDAKRDDATTAGAEQPAQVYPHIPPGLDVGHVVDVKGGVSLFRQQKQIKVEKLVMLGSTDQELKFWTKMQQFRTGVLSKPWSLDKKVLRKCRKEAEGVNEARENKRRRVEAVVVDQRDCGSRDHIREVEAAASRGRKLTGLEKRPKRRTSHSRVQGKYDALGL